MRQRESLISKFNVRPESGSVRPRSARYTTKLYAKVGNAYVRVSDESVISLALQVVSKRIALSDPLLHPRAAREYVALRFSHLEHEVFSCLFLDAVHRVIDCVELFRGSIAEAEVCPREVVKEALAHNARAIILVHNHPSGVAVPSDTDIQITRRLKQTLGLVDVKVLDHLVVGAGTVDSMSERGLV